MKGTTALEAELAQLEKAKLKTSRARDLWARRRATVIRIEAEVKRLRADIRQALKEEKNAARLERTTAELELEKAARRENVDLIVDRLTSRIVEEGKCGIWCLDEVVIDELAAKGVTDTSSLQAYLDSETWVLSSTSTTGNLRWKVSGLVKGDHEIQVSILSYALRAIGWPGDNDNTVPEQLAHCIKAAIAEAAIQGYLCPVLGRTDDQLADVQQMRDEARLRRDWELKSDRRATAPEFAEFDRVRYAPGPVVSWLDLATPPH